MRLSKIIFMLVAWASVAFQASAQWEVTLTNNTSLNSGAALGTITNTGGSGATTNPYVYTFTSGGLDLQGYKITTKQDAEDPKGTSFLLNMGGYSVTGSSGVVSFDTVTDDSSWEGCGWVSITNVSSVSIGAIETYTIRGRSFPGYVSIGTEAYPVLENIRVDRILSYSTITVSGYGGAAINIYGGGDVIIGTTGGVTGDISSYSMSSQNRPITISHNGSFSVNDILNYWYSPGFGNYASSKNLVLHGNNAGAPIGTCVVRNIDTHIEGAAGQKWMGNGGSVTVSGYTSVNLNNVSTYHLSKEQNLGTPSGGFLTVSNITGDISISGDIDLSATNTAGGGTIDGELYLQCNGNIHLSNLNLSKIRHARLLPGGTNYITGYIVGTDESPLTGSSGLLLNGSGLRTPTNIIAYYNPYANPSLLGVTYSLEDDAGTAGAGGTLEPLASTVYTSIKSGNWNDPTVWDLGSVPTNITHSAVVSDSHTVKITNDIATIMGITVQSNASLSLDKPTTPLATTQYIVAKDGAIIQSGDQNITQDLSGTLALEGVCTFRPHRGVLTILSSISGSNVTLRLNGLSPGNSNQKATVLAGNNSFYGEIDYEAKSSYLVLSHDNALGTKSNLTITVKAYTGTQASDANFLVIMNTANSPANLTTVVCETANFPSFFGHGRGVTVASSTILNAGAAYINYSTTQSGSRYNTGGIHISAGVTGLVNRGGATYDTSYMDAPISGSGALHILGGDGNTGQQHWRAASTNTGGARITSSAYGQADKTVAYGNTPFGSGPIWLDGIGYTTMLLAENVSWTNNIRGQGRINTSTHTLTVAGSLSPFDTGYDTVPVTVIGQPGADTFRIDNLQFGTATDSATYYWDYNSTTNDVVTTVNLTFGTAAQNIVVNWDGASKEGEFVLFTWTGATAPTIPTFNVTGLPSGYRGRVENDVGAKSVMLKTSIEASGEGESFLVPNLLLEPNVLFVQ